MCTVRLQPQSVMTESQSNSDHASLLEYYFPTHLFLSLFPFHPFSPLTLGLFFFTPLNLPPITPTAYPIPFLRPFLPFS